MLQVNDSLILSLSLSLSRSWWKEMEEILLMAYLETAKSTLRQNSAIMMTL